LRSDRIVKIRKSPRGWELIFSQGLKHGISFIRLMTAGVGVSHAFFFESVLAKKVRTDPALAVTDPLRSHNPFLWRPALAHSPSKCAKASS